MIVLLLNDVKRQFQHDVVYMEVYIILYDGEIVNGWAKKKYAEAWLQDATKFLDSHQFKDKKYTLHKVKLKDAGKQKDLGEWL